jgi:hypothetical protein
VASSKCVVLSTWGDVGMTIPVYWLTPGEQWDQTMLRDLLDGDLWKPSQLPTFEHYTGELIGMLAPEELIYGGVLVIPGRYYAQPEAVAGLSRWLESMPWALVMVTSDEERVFPLWELERPNTVVWVQTPKADDDSWRVFGHGYSPGTRSVAMTGKALPWFFAGQVTHSRRQGMAEALREIEPVGGFKMLIENSKFLDTENGLDHETYLSLMAETMTAPAPSGPCTQDSFRFWEALELGCVPLADNQTPNGDSGYWERLFGNQIPFPVVDDWADLDRLIPGEVADFPANANHIGAWYMEYKRDLAEFLEYDLARLSSPEQEDTRWEDQITVLIPTSPCPAHPSTELLEATITSIRFHLPDAVIIVSCDGVPPAMEHRRSDYEEYVRRVVWKCHHEWVNVQPIVHSEHLHQAAMALQAIQLQVSTPVILYVEHDTPLVMDCPIDWEPLVNAVEDQVLNLVRLHFEARVPEPHLHLMLDNPWIDGNWWNGLPVIRTMQWSQRPHLANTAWYQSVLEDYFGEHARTMIEDVMHGVTEGALIEGGSAGWDEWRLAIYAPRGGNWKRSLNLDGRGNDPKVPMVFDYPGDTPPGAPAPGVR